MTWLARCPAKINLFLSVGPPDVTGYHPLRTIFQAVGLFDELRMTLDVAQTEIVCDWPGLPQQNTLQKVLALSVEYTDLPPMRLELVKRIPAESGLGGGSSDAAGLIRLLARALPDRFRPEDLAAIARAVGADVPFFLVGGRARAEGYGERLTPLPDPARSWVLIARPTLGCSTPEMYRKLDETERPWREFPPEDETVPLYNDFERVAPCACLELTERLQIHGARGALLSGSGSAVFGLFDSEATAMHTRDRLEDEQEVRCWIVPTLTRQESVFSEMIALET